jgi:hypothetical protein
MGLVGADLAELRTLVVQLGGPMRAEVGEALAAMNKLVQASSSYWVAADGDKFRADFAGFVTSTTTKLDASVQSAAKVTGQNLAAIERATEGQALLPYFEPRTVLVPQWGNLIPSGAKQVTSGEEGSLYYGSAGYLFSKYGIGHRLLLPPSAQTPWPIVPRMDDLPPGEEITVQGEHYVPSDSGILVPAGTPGVDPRVPVPGDDLGAGWKTGVDAGLRFDPVNVPTWAKYGSKGLFVAGAGLTLYGTWESSWQDDEALHPNWSEPERITDVAQKTVVEGGSTVAGAWAGAEVGAEGGAALGAMIGSAVPILGTAAGGVVGGLVGGIVGGFVGGQVGSAVGHGLEDAGSAIWHGLGL